MRRSTIFWVLIVGIPLLLMLAGSLVSFPFFNQGAIEHIIQEAGVAAPVLFVIINILQVVVTPFSHYIVGISGGVLFGTWNGFLLNWTGRVIGSCIAFVLARRFGRSIINRFVQESTLQKYDSLFERGVFVLFLMYFLPLFPDDELSYLAGISDISFWNYFTAVSLGSVGGSLALAYIGSGVSVRDPLFIILSIITIFCAGALFWVQRNRVNNPSLAH